MSYIRELEEKVKENRNRHEAEYLMKQAEEAVENILPVGVQLILKAKEMCVEDLGGAMMGMMLMSKNDDEVAKFTMVAMELTCQAVISRKMEEE